MPAGDVSGAVCVPCLRIVVKGNYENIHSQVHTELRVLPGRYFTTEPPGELAAL